MFKRKYFFSVKVAHNDGSGDYSWWYDIITHNSLITDPETVMNTIRNNAVEVLAERVPRMIWRTDIEFVSFNRI